MFCVILITFSVFCFFLVVVKKLDMGHYTKGIDLILLLISLCVNVGSFFVYTLPTIHYDFLQARQ